MQGATHGNVTSPITLTAEQVQAVIGGFDLRTYDGWRRAAYALLKDKPEWTAIKTDGLGYVVWCEGDALLIEEDVDALSDNLLDIDDQGWDYELGCWAVTTPGTSNSWLVYPEFVTLVPAEEQGDLSAAETQPGTLEDAFDLPSDFSELINAARIHCAEQIEEIEANPSFYSAANLAEADNHRFKIERQAEALERYAAMRKRQAQAQSN